MSTSSTRVTLCDIIHCNWKVEEFMKSLYFCILVFGLIIGTVGCTKEVEVVTVNTSDNDDPENIYRQRPDIDMFVYNGTAYVNAEDVDWVMKLELTPDVLLCQIEAQYVDGDFKNYDSTKLEVGTEVYLVEERRDILVVKLGETYYRYLAWVEG